MKETDKLMSELEKLARIELSDEEREKCLSDMQKIISYMNILDELDVADAKLNLQTALKSGAMRDDEVLPSAQIEEVLKNAPRSQRGYFEVPKTVE